MIANLVLLAAFGHLEMLKFEPQMVMQNPADEKTMRNLLERFEGRVRTVGDIKAIAMMWSFLGDNFAYLIVPIAIDYKNVGDAQRIAQEILAIWGARAAPDVAKHLSSRDPELLAHVVRLLGDMRARQYSNELILLRNHDDRSVRTELVSALAKFHDRRSILPLLDIAWGGDERAFDAIASFELDATEAIPSLVEHLVKHADTDAGTLIFRPRGMASFPEWYPCYYQIHALVRAGPTATKHLGKILADPKFRELHKSVFFAVMFSTTEFREMVRFVKGQKYLNGPEYSLERRKDLLDLAKNYLKDPIDEEAGKLAKLLIETLFDDRGKK